MNSILDSGDLPSVLVSLFGHPEYVLTDDMKNEVFNKTTQCTLDTNHKTGIKCLAYLSNKFLIHSSLLPLKYYLIGLMASLFDLSVVNEIANTDDIELVMLYKYGNVDGVKELLKACELGYRDRLSDVDKLKLITLFGADLF